MFSTNRKKYLLELKALLAFMDAEDRELALRHFEERFNAVGESGEAALIETLGTPLRQVLRLEKRYRERQEKGLPLFDEAELTAEAAETREAVQQMADAEGEGAEGSPECAAPMEQEAPEFCADDTEASGEPCLPTQSPLCPDDPRAETDPVFPPSSTAEYEEGAGEAEDPDREIADADREAEESESGQGEFPEEPCPGEALPEDEGDLPLPQQEESEGEELTLDSPVPYDALPSQLLSDAAGEMLSGVDFGEEPAEDGDEGPEEAPAAFDYDKFIASDGAGSQKSPAKSRRKTRNRAAKPRPPAVKLTPAQLLAAVLLLPVALVLAVLGVGLSALVAAIPLGIFGIFGAASLYLALYAVTGMPYLPDMLTVLGLAVVLLAVTVLFLWMGLAVILRGIRLTVHGIALLYSRVLGKERSE